jgi:hypothetical protein
MTESTWGGPRPVTRPDDKRKQNVGGARLGAGRPKGKFLLRLGDKVYVTGLGLLVVASIAAEQVELHSPQGQVITLKIA